MTKLITATVNVVNPETHTVTTLIAGDAIPEWAEPLITNPAVFTDFPDAAVQEFTGEPPAAGEENPPASDENPPADDENKPDGDDEAVTRPELEARAKELKIRFTAETTDPELAAFIASKE